MICEFEKRRDLIYSLVNDTKFLSALKPEGAFYIWVDISATVERVLKAN